MKDGKEKEQGIGYLDDGTMVVVEDGRKFIGKRTEVSVYSILQTSSGRMIFAKISRERMQDELTFAGAVVVAGGLGKRMGRPKQMLPLAGRPVLLRAVQALAKVPCIKQIVVVTAPENREILKKTFSPKLVCPARGHAFGLRHQRRGRAGPPAHRPWPCMTGPARWWTRRPWPAV